MSITTKVTVKQGRIVGEKDFLPNGNPYYFFKGIPYAEPPLGKLRFRAPIPLQKFSSPEIECTKEGNMSFQRDRSGNFIGSEDCLFLNVYTPNIRSKELLPVMVFISGGKFIIGSGNSDNYNPLYLMQENVVVVTINYRLGPLGFLAFPEGGIPGNSGLKDQRLALQWVQENISKFCGDHNNVTLFGQSAGSISAHIHIFSERSRKLFHKAILQSGLGNMPLMIEDNASFKTIELAKKLGCTSDKPIDVAEFLQQSQHLKRFFEPCYELHIIEKIQSYLSVSSRPVIEAESVEAVFTKTIFQSMKAKNSIDIPIIIGCNSADGIALVTIFIEVLEQLENQLHYFIAGVDKNPKKIQHSELAIKEFYFKEQNIDKSTLNELSDFFTDVFFLKPAREIIEMHSRMQHISPLYFYIFDFEGTLNMYKKKYKLDNIIKGVSHCDELNYIFQTAIAPEPWNKREKNMVQTMCNMWTNFAKYSDPTLSCEWMPVRKIEHNEEFSLEAYIIDENGKMVKNYFKERMDFWIDLTKTMNNLI